MMLHSLKDLKDFSIHATDGNIGQVKDFYFDDRQWGVRYLIVETGSWFDKKQVLLSPISIKHINIVDKTLTVSISKEQVKNSPSVDTQKPVSRQYEIDYLGYYGYPFYWENTGLWGSYSSPSMMAPGYIAEKNSLDTPDVFANVDAMKNRTHNHHLRSATELVDYHIEALNGEIGHMQGMLVDTESWAVRYLIVNTSNWWMGHSVLVAPDWIKKVSWPESKICVDMTQEQVKNAPLYDSDMHFSRELERDIHTHYGRLGYWERKPARA